VALFEGNLAKISTKKQKNDPVLYRPGITGWPRINKLPGAGHAMPAPLGGLFQSGRWKNIQPSKNRLPEFNKGICFYHQRSLHLNSRKVLVLEKNTMPKGGVGNQRSPLLATRGWEANIGITAFPSGQMIYLTKRTAGHLPSLSARSSRKP